VRRAFQEIQSDISRSLVSHPDQHQVDAAVTLAAQLGDGAKALEGSIADLNGFLTELYGQRIHLVAAGTLASVSVLCGVGSGGRHGVAAAAAAAIAHHIRGVIACGQRCGLPDDVDGLPHGCRDHTARTAADTARKRRGCTHRIDGR